MSSDKDLNLGRILWDSIKYFFIYLSGKKRVKNFSLSQNLKELRQLYESVSLLYDSSVFADLDPYELSAVVSITAIKKAGLKVTEQLVTPFFETVFLLAEKDGLVHKPEIDWNQDFSWSQQLELRSDLRRLKQIYSGGEPTLDHWVNTLEMMFGGILIHFPKQIEFEKTKTGFLNIDLAFLLRNPAESIEHIMSVVSEEEILFQDLRKKLENNVLNVSEINPTNHKNTKPFIHPTKSKLEPIELVENYLKHTPFENIFIYPCPFSIPLKIRYEHCHIIGGTGHGKTQLLQTLILEDIKANRGFCVIDSQGDLINKITMLSRFDSSEKDSLADKVIIIDPTDTDFPVCLNMFALNSKNLSGLTSTQKEMLLNATVDLYSYMFGALFGAELTQRQGVIFNYLARLMMEIPDATIQTLRELMEDGRKYKPYMNRLQGSARAFFETQFFSKSFAQTKKQVLARLWSVLSNATLERMFSNTENKVDIFDAINSGKVLLVNTAKDLLRKEGSQILGRFFIALLGQSILRRTSIPEKKRKPFFVYIDEAHEYFDERIDEQLNQARKYKVGLTLAHQNLDQLNSSLKGTMMSSTSIKLAGGVSSLDAVDLAREMHTTSDNLLRVRKNDNRTEFACWIKNVTPGTIPIKVPFGLLEKEPVLSQDSYTRLIQRNREKYCLPVEQIIFDVPQEEEDVASAPTPTQEDKPSIPQKEPRPVVEPHAVKKQPELEKQVIPPKKEKIELKVKETISKKDILIPSTGKGGPHHRYLQNLIKRLAQERGFKAVTEQPVFDGAGSVDVSVEGNGKKIAVEISVSTGSQWEMQNISKCLSAGYDNVVLISSENKQLNKLKEGVSESFLKEIQEGKILFFLPDNFISYLDDIKAKSAQKTKTVRGYKVKVNYSTVSTQEEKMKKDAIAKVITDSMRRMK